MYQDMVSSGNFCRSWSKNPIFFRLGKMYVVTWAPFVMVGLTSRYLEFLLIFMLGASSLPRKMYPGNMVADPYPDASALWVVLNIY